MPRPPWPSGFDVRGDSKQPQSATSTCEAAVLRSPCAARCRAGRTARRARPRSRTPRSWRAPAPTWSDCRARAPSPRRARIARAVGAPSGVAGSHACLMPFGVFPSPDRVTRGNRARTPERARVARQEADCQRDRGEDRAGDHHGLRAAGLGGRTGQQVADRQQGQRAHPLPGTRAGERVRRDPLGHRGVPEHLEQREAGPGGHRQRQHERHGHARRRTSTIENGHTAITRNAARIGWRGRQRSPISAPVSAPAP